jgi:hypothetical protein
MLLFSHRLILYTGEFLSDELIVTFSLAQAFTGCVRTASGSDRINKNREIHLGAVRCHPFRERFILIRRAFLIRSLPLAVLTQPLYAWVGNGGRY